MVSTVAVAVVVGAASAFGGWTFGEVGHLYHRVHKIQDRVDKLTAHK